MPLPAATAKEQYDARALVVNADGSTTGTRVFRVEYPETFDACTNAEKDEVTTHARTQTGVDRWDAFPGEPRCLAQTCNVSNGGSQRLWMLTYGYSDRFESVDGGAGGAQAAELTADGLDVASSGAASSPAGGDRSAEAEARPYTVRSIERTIQEVLTADQITGNRFTNTAGDPFDPPLMREVTVYGYEVTWFRYAANLRWAPPATNPPFGRPDYTDTINQTAFKVFGRNHAARSLRVSKVSATMTWDKGPSGALTQVFELRAEILHKPGGWKRAVLNQGLRELTAAGEPLRPILDSAGQPVTDPYPLNAVGAKLSAGGALVYVECWEYPEKNLIELFQ